MRAGNLRHRVTVQRPADTRGATGEAVQGFADVVTRWADVRPARGVEALAAGIERVARNTYDVRLRYESALSGITAKWRIVTNEGRVLQIVSVPPRAANTRELVLVCDERV